MKTKPIQRVSSVIALVALVLSALVVPALAAPPASVTLAKGASVFPGEDRVYEFTVRNDGGNALTAEPIDWVRVILPTNVGVNLSSEAPAGPAGWTVEKVESRFLNAVIYRASSPLNEIRGANTGRFSFTADVARPASTSRRGDLKVDVSSDGGQSASSLPALKVDVEILEVVKAPTIATGNPKLDDGSATAGQTLAYEVQLKNHAASEVTLATASLTPLTADVVGAASYEPVSDKLAGAGSDLTVAPTVTKLSYTGISTLSRTSNPENTTIARKGDATVKFKGTYAEVNRPFTEEDKKNKTTESGAYTVQAPASLQVTELIPAFTRSTVTLDDGTEKPFRTKVELLAKRLGNVSIANYVLREGTPASPVSAISFADTNGVLDGGSPIADATVRRLFFTDTEGNSLTGGDGNLEIEGAEGTYEASLSIKVTDANGSTYVTELSKLLDLNPITIINGGPDSRLDVDINPDIAEDERARTATRDGEPVEFTYYVFAPEGQSEAEFRDSLDLDSAKVTLMPNGLTSTDASFEDEYAFEGDPTWETGVEYTTATGEKVQRNALKFVQTVNPDWPGDIDTDTDSDTISFKGFGSIEDNAGNTAGDESIKETVDNVRPEAPLFGFTGKDEDSNSVIQLVFTDGLNTDFFDGCDPSLYRIDNIPGRVAEVRYGVNDQTPCTADGPNTPVRVLVLNYELERNETPDVDYLLRDPATATSLGQDPIIDGAFNPVEKSTIQTLVGIRPAAPSIIEVTRTNTSDPNEGNERELAFVDPEGATHTYDSNGDDAATVNTIPQYWTNTGGGLGDLEGTSNNPGDLLVTFTGAQDGYTIVVEDELGNVLRRKPVSGQSQLDPSDDGERTVFVPLPNTPDCTDAAADGYCTYTRFLRFVPADQEKFAEDLTGLPSVIEVALDVKAPTLASITAPNADDFVTVGFSEHILSAAEDRASGSSDRAEDWYAWETIAGEQSFYGANEIAAPSSVFEREIRFSFQQPSLFSGAEYFLTSASSKLSYEDRAGNHLANQQVLK